MQEGIKRMTINGLTTAQNNTSVMPKEFKRNLTITL
jgi:hypothetical protein